MYIYRTYFKLLAPVLDVKEAQDFLQADDMTEYLKRDTYHCKNVDKASLVSIKWILRDEDSGYIELIANTELSQDDLDSISEWVSGQNSDGLGESFEQQDFACYCSHDTPNYWEYDEEWEAMTPVDDRDWFMASFDWQTNDYKFELERIE